MNSQHDFPSMAYDVSGSGAPLVLLPGGLTGWLSWMPHAETLSVSRKVARLQLLCVQLGLSDAPLPPAYSIEFEISALAKTVDELGIGQADFAAWSLGGEIALSYAIHNAERVRSLTLIEPPAFWVLQSRGSFSEVVRAEQANLKKMATDEVSEAQLVQFAHFSGLVPENVDPRTVPPWPAWYKHRQSLRVGDAAFRHQDDIEDVRDFDKPVLLVKGEGSSPLLHEIMDILGEEFPSADTITFPGGHAPHIMSMRPFLERFTHFLAAGSLE